eukprot:7458650-Ditylum_brightwellii.AAC.1
MNSFPVAIPHLDQHTQLYLDQLRRVDNAIVSKAEPMTFDEYVGEVKRLQERTSSGPSMVTPAMIKTEILDPYLADINWRASNFTWCTGYSPKRYREGLDLLIYKRSNDNQ